MPFRNTGKNPEVEMASVSAWCVKCELSLVRAQKERPVI